MLKIEIAGFLNRDISGIKLADFVVCLINVLIFYLMDKTFLV